MGGEGESKREGRGPVRKRDREVRLSRAVASASSDWMLILSYSAKHSQNLPPSVNCLSGGIIRHV